MKTCAVVIPSYTASLKKNEKIALEQCIKILGKYDIYFMLPQSLEIDYDRASLKKVRYSDQWFWSVAAYSEFMLKPDLYRDFLDYEYILIYQLDAFVFYDRLEYFCSLNYDYIGAPWPDGGLVRTMERLKTVYVGNGGFSLRKVDRMLNFVEKAKDQIKVFHALNVEDVIIAELGKEYLRIAPMEVACEFSFEMNDKKIFEYTGNKLPFGCHALLYHNYNLWKEYVEKRGYSVEKAEKRYSYDSEFQRRRSALREVYSERDIIGILKNHLPTYKDKICIWGVGEYGKNMFCIMNGAGLSIEFYVDKNADKMKTLLGHPVITIEEFLGDKKLPVIVAMKDTKEVEEILLLNGYENGKDYITYNTILNILMDKYAI